MVQRYSFDLKPTYISFKDMQFYITVHTFENIYTLDGDSLVIEEDKNGMDISCNKLKYAGGRKEVSCFLIAKISSNCDQSARIKISVEMDQEVRCVRLVLNKQDGGKIINRIDATPLEINDQGVILNYPEAWRTLATPMVIVKTQKGYDYYRSKDKEVSAKRFVFIGDSQETQVELIYDTPATKIGCNCHVPEWEIGHGKTLEDIYEPHISHVKNAYNLTEWEQRRDVPYWARNISLVIALHGMHWSGKIFNTYDDMCKKLEILSKEIDPARVMIYIPGFEGRYYWQYGEYGACDELGGERGLKALVARAHELGYHIVPMLGINITNTKTEGYERFGAPSQFVTSGGLYPKNIVDWDSSRAFDHGWCAYLNPGAPQWQNRLVEQITHIIKEFSFDGVYLDITGMWIDDANFDVAEGTRELVKRIHLNCRDTLVLGEAWYDGIADVFPFVQNGHTSGEMHYYDEIYPGFFNRFCRMFGHLCLGDVGSNSTGVHELGYNVTTSVPLREGIIPTLTLLGDTLEKDFSGVREILEQANQYYSHFLCSLTSI